MNVRLLIEYDGTEFAGWQRQPHRPTIQAHIEDVLEKVTGKRTVLYGASRTDSGVHAMGQVANFHTESLIAAERWSVVLNYYLPRTIRILESREMPPEFHAQKDAVSKIYEYRILNRQSASALDRRVHFYPGELDWDAMEEALPHLVGEKDFRAFQGAKAEVRTTVRRISRLELLREGNGMYRFRVEGNGFLKQMVRTLVGTLIEVGEGKRTAGGIEAMIATRDRRQAGRTLPPSGLCLVTVSYGGSDSPARTVDA